MIKKIRFIDLGLPSKILWGNKNLENNKYYQWGDLRGYSKYQVGEEKIFYWKHYKFYKDDRLIKYNNSDKLLELLPEDDIVTQTLGNNYKVPGKKDFEELLEYTDKIYTEDSVIFKSKINGNQIIFPLLGFAIEISISDAGYYCSFWSSSLYENYIADSWKLSINRKGESAYMLRNNRCHGCVIRPIKFKV